jgi:hypothetical protein
MVVCDLIFAAQPKSPNFKQLPTSVRKILAPEKIWHTK